MRGALLVLIGAVGLIAVFAAAVAIKVSVWSECRADHSWLYCVHLISN
jgi:hypothetical protein